MSRLQFSSIKQPFILARIFMVAIIVATILNGSCFWLRRVGWLEPHIFRTEWSKLASAAQTSEEYNQLTMRFYQTEGIWKVSKGLKDGVFLSFIFVSLLLMWKSGTMWRMRYCSLFIAIVILLFYSLTLSIFKFGPLLPMAGLRSFLFLGVAITGAWAVTDESFSFLTRCLVGLILFQLLLSPFELMYGAHLFDSGRFGHRIAGTMLQPGSLGIISGLGLILYYTFFRVRIWFWLLTTVVCFLIFYSGSGTAMLLLLFASIMVLGSKILKRYRKWFQFYVIAIGSFTVFVLLPVLTGRTSIYDSISGRILLFKEHIFTDTCWFELLFGRGLGAGTNTAVNLMTNLSAEVYHGSGSSIVFIADSTPLMLVAQIGIVGFFLVYGVLFLAAYNDQQTRLLYLCIILVSMTVNVTEFFPVNFILGLLLSRSLLYAKDKDFSVLKT